MDKRKVADALMNRWLYSLRATLQGRLEASKDDLQAGGRANRKAKKEAIEILNWLEPPPVVPSDRDRITMIHKIYRDKTLSCEQQRQAVWPILRQARRARGRPRSDTPQHALAAYSLYQRTQLTWREVTKQVKGCEHRDSDAQRSCPECSDALQNAVRRMKRFLDGIGVDTSIPRRKELDRLPNQSSADASDRRSKAAPR